MCIRDRNDGALAFRDIMNIPYGSENIKDLVNYRIVMNFASMASNPYHTTACLLYTSGILFETIVELFNEGKPVDLITLQNRLREKEMCIRDSNRPYIRWKRRKR